jgi:hypothetical protein
MGSCFGRAEEDAIYLRDNLQLMGFDVKDIQKLTALYESIVEAKQAVSVETFAGLAGIVTSPFLQKLFRVPTEIRRSVGPMNLSLGELSIALWYNNSGHRPLKYSYCNSHVITCVGQYAH